MRTATWRRYAGSRARSPCTRACASPTRWPRTRRVGWQVWRCPRLEEQQALVGSVAQEHDVTLVEGAGGLLVRLGEGYTLADVLAPYDARWVVVARAGLGTLNHTELTVAALHDRGRDVAGVVIGSWPEHPDLAEQQNLLDLPRVTGVPLLGQGPGRCGGAAGPRVPARCSGLGAGPSNRCRGCGSAATNRPAARPRAGVSTDEGPAVKASTGIRGTCTYGERSITHCGSDSSSPSWPSVRNSTRNAQPSTAQLLRRVYAATASAATSHTAGAWATAAPTNRPTDNEPPALP